MRRGWSVGGCRVRCCCVEVRFSNRRAGLQKKDGLATKKNKKRRRAARPKGEFVILGMEGNGRGCDKPEMNSNEYCY